MIYHRLWSQVLIVYAASINPLTWGSPSKCMYAHTNLSAAILASAAHFRIGLERVSYDYSTYSVVLFHSRNQCADVNYHYRFVRVISR